MFTVGDALLHIQTLEFVLSRCLTCVFPPEAEMTTDRLYALDAQNQSKTLGQLLKTLRNTVEIEPEFDSRLRNYLEKRNLFVHGLFLDERFDFNTDEGCGKLTAFLDDVYDDVEYLRTVFTAVYAQWRKALDGEELGLENMSPTDRAKWEKYMEKHESAEILTMRLKPGRTMGIGFFPSEI